MPINRVTSRIAWHFSALVLALGMHPLHAQQTAAPPVPAATAPTTFAPAPPVALNEGYVLGPGDVIEVSVLGRPDFVGRVQVQVDGTIQLPLIKDIRAADRTVLQLRSDIRSRLVSGGYFNDPAVSVVIASFASRYVTVLGEVATPGLLPIDRSYRLSEIVARVGGLRASAAEEVILSRSDGTSVSLNLRDVATGPGQQDPVVNPGDRIFVAPAAQFYIYGAVNGPGSFRLDRGMSFRMALARAGGLTAQGSAKRIKVIREGKEIRRIDLNALVQPGDTVVVGERFF